MNVPGLCLAAKIQRKRRAKRWREVLRQLRLKFFDYAGTDRIGRYNQLIARLRREIQRLG